MKPPDLDSLLVETALLVSLSVLAGKTNSIRGSRISLSQVPQAMPACRVGRPPRPPFRTNRDSARPPIAVGRWNSGASGKRGTLGDARRNGGSDRAESPADICEDTSVIHDDAVHEALHVLNDMQHEEYSNARCAHRAVIHQQLAGGRFRSSPSRNRQGVIRIGVCAPTNPNFFCDRCPRHARDPCSGATASSSMSP